MSLCWKHQDESKAWTYEVPDVPDEPWPAGVAYPGLVPNRTWIDEAEGRGDSSSKADSEGETE